jgi:hypothetical protein
MVEEDNAVGIIRNSREPADINHVTAFERRRGIKLPESYRRFILEQNGGEPDPNYFEINGFEGGGSLLDYLADIAPDSTGGLDKLIDMFPGRLPAGFIPIGLDPGGSLICLGLNAPCEGKIYYWDHEMALDSKGLNKRNMSNMYWLADDIYELLNRLADLPE